MQQWLQEKWRVRVKYKTLPRLIYYRFKARLKVARPSHVKQTLRRPGSFAKNSGHAASKQWLER